MHIAFCSPQWPPAGAANGIVSYVAAVRSYFLQMGHQVSVIAGERLFDSSDRPQPLLGAADPHRRSFGAKLGRRIDHMRGTLPDVGRRVAAQIDTARRIAGIDIAEMEESFGWCDAVRVRSAVPIVTRLHGPYFLKPPVPGTARDRYAAWRRNVAEGNALRAAPSLTAPSRTILEATCSHYGIANGGLRAVIPNPISLTRPEQRWRADACELGHVLMVGRFDYWKGADTMLAAFDRLTAMRPDARLTLVGPDEGIDGLKFADYATSKLSPEARRRIEFTGTLPPDRIVELRRRAALTVMASRQENFPYALLEGLAAGCPMISTEWPGSSEVIEHGVSGLLTPVGEPESLANQLDWMIEHPNEAAQLGAAGLDRCRQRFSVEVVGAAMLDHYHATLRTYAR